MITQPVTVPDPESHKPGQLRVQPLGPVLGARVEGIDLNDVDAAGAAAIRAAFHAHAVLVFLGQDLAPARQIAFTRLFGDVHRHPLYRSKVLEGYPEILVLEHEGGKFYNGRNDVWHADVTFAEAPPLGSILHCKDACSGYGDTLFCSMSAAYEALSSGLQRLLEGMYAEHSALRMVERNNAQSYNVPMPEVPPPVLHPVVTAHPETGRRALFVNPIYTLRFADMTEEESRPLFDYLFALATRPENVYRHRWQVGDVVMFDNRCLMHYVSVDYGPQMHRLMHRTTAAGSPPRAATANARNDTRADSFC